MVHYFLRSRGIAANDHRARTLTSAFLYRRDVPVFRRPFVQCVPVSNDVRYDPEPRSSDDSHQADLMSIIRRKDYDAALPSLNLRNRSRLRLTLDLIVGIPLLLILWGLDGVRVRLERMMSRIYRDAPANRHEKGRKTQESSDQREGELG
jgi:hypothetical protein